MDKLHVKYLLVGGGVAAASAAQEIRARDPEGSIILVTQESTRPYHRAPLATEALQRRLPRQHLFIHQAPWYTQHRIELRTGRRAIQLDTPRQCVILDDASELTYDRLLLATGASPRHLNIAGHELPGVHYLRTYPDLERLHHAIDKARAEGHRHVLVDSQQRGRAVLIGSGLLATELSVSLTQMGIEVDLLLKRDHPWTHFAGETVGKWAMRALQRAGVAVHPYASPIRLEGDGRVQRAILPDHQSIQCDFALAAVGVAANRELLRGTPIAAEKAILTDPACRTSIENVFAAGDCAAVFDPLFNRHRLLDHFESAAHLGALAGRNMAGAQEQYRDVSHFSTYLFAHRVDVWGESRHVHHRLVRGAGGLESGPLVELGISGDNRVSQAIAIDQSGSAIEALREMVLRRLDIAGLEDRIRDPETSLQDLL